MAFKDMHYAQTPLAHALGFIGEEGNELALEVFKIARFGLLDGRPDAQVNNLHTLQAELSDLVAAVRVANMELAAHGLPQLVLDDEVAIQKKITKLAFYGHRSMRNCTLAAPLQIMSTQSPE